MAKKKQKQPISNAEHVANEGLKCPFCGSEDIEGDSVEIDEGQALQEMSCNECEKQWTDVYKLTSFNPTEV